MQNLTNPYPGINAHLNSRLQNDGNWPDFHATYLVFLRNALKTQLAPLGYTAGIEQSLQIRVAPTSTRDARVDVALYDTQFPRSDTSTGMLHSASEQTIPLPDLLDIESAEDYFPALMISKRDSGEPVVWMELLSPTNKLPSSAFQVYAEKLRDVLSSGLVFMELDYLHQQPPTFPRLPDYTHGEPGAHPYRIAVVDPRPRLSEGQGHLYEFDADMPFPLVTIPLRGTDNIAFDFGAPYHKTFEEARYGDDLDYHRPPVAFETYSPADCERILQRMARVTNPSIKT